MGKELIITSLEDIKKQITKVIELPGWEEGVPFVVRVKRISFLDLIQGEHLPNELLGIAHKMIQGSGEFNPMNSEDPSDIKRFAQLMHLVAESCLVEPTYREIYESGGYLTQNQLTAIFMYSNLGIRSLESFRTESGTLAEDRGSSENMGESPE